MTLPRMLLAGLFTTLLISQGWSEEKKKRKPRPAPVVSPLIKGAEVTFQIKAPRAEEVLLTGEMIDRRIPLKKNENGIWSLTIDTIESGLYGYSFVVDGLQILDPGNPQSKPMRSPKTSILHLPGDHPYDFKDVPHGTVHTHTYFSDPIQRQRSLRVYTPPGYETSDDRYPLLVLQHGHSDSYATWTTYGKAHWILDNLIAEKKAVPMIVVMLDGHPIPESYGKGRSPENTEELRKDLLDAALPLLEKSYRLLPGRDHRAIAGLSMGGLHALTIGTQERDTFSAVGSFSGAIPEQSVFGSVLSKPETFNKEMRLLWIACGKDDFLLGENEKLNALLESKGIQHDWVLTEGGHSWPVWRDYLTQFAPLLFQNGDL